MSDGREDFRKVGGGTIGWMVRNRVTPNILMLTALVGGLFMTTQIKQEVFPEFSLDLVTVRVPYPGASPEEVEQGIVLVVEEAIRGLEGVKEVTAVASEGFGQVTAELLESADRQKAYQDIQQAIARVDTFPDDAEEPEISLNVMRREVLEVEIYGAVSEVTLREAAEYVRDRLLSQAGITQVELSGAREQEIHVEVAQETLRRYGWTLADVAQALRVTAVEIPGGKVETRGGEILLRLTERRDWAGEFGRLPVLTQADGTKLRVEDIAEVREGFRDTDEEATFNGERAIGVEVYRIGDQTPIGVSEAVHEAMDQIETELPEGIEWSVRNDRSEVYKQRLELLLKNAFMGLVLVLVTLGLFLEFRLAFWVTMGIPVSFLGGLLFLPLMDVSINMMSLFAFIIALGMVVDDAIVAGENIYEYRQKGMGLVEASIRGARDVAMPVTFSILTNIAAFLPLLFVPGMMGKTWKVIPMVVCTVFTISLSEAIWILPSHLAHARTRAEGGIAARLHGWQQAFSRGFMRFVEKGYVPFLDVALHHRALTLALGAGLLVLTLGYVKSGRMGFVLMPKVEADVSVVTATLPFGTSMDQMRQVREHLERAGEAVVAEHGGEKLCEGVFAIIRENQVEVRLYLTEPEVRPIGTAVVTELWRERAGAVSGAESVRFESDRGGPGGGAALTVELSHRDIETLDRASEALAARLAEFSVVKDIDDGYAPGKRQLNFRITAQSGSLGLTAREIATQVRYAFQGAEAIKQQRGRNEVTVRVRRPEGERVSEYDVERMILRTPAGGQAPLLEVAKVERGRAYTAINRRDGRRTVTVTADVSPQGETSRVQAALDGEVLPGLARDFAGLTYGYEGRQADMAESLAVLTKGMLAALVVIYVLLAIPFRSYVQPVIVMLSIPFGIIGAVLGHLLMGYTLSIISLMGMVALAGVVVNDALVLIDYANRLVREEGLSYREAARQSAARRFRPVLLTTLTTFGGLAPMIFETSRQARFMIPMALSLGYGILFATAITLVLIPTLYVLLSDLRGPASLAARAEEQLSS